MITPIELQSKTFKSGGLGYDKKDVESFFREVLRSYEQIYRENMESSDKIAVLTEGIQYYKTIEKTLQKALVLAEKTAEDTKMAALEKAKAIEKEAKVRSQLIVADAKNELEHIHNQTIQLIQQYEKYKCQFKHLAKAQMELIESECFNINLARLDAFIDTQFQDIKETNENREVNETKEFHETNEGRESKEAKVFHETNEGRESKEAIASNQTKENEQEQPLKPSSKKKLMRKQELVTEDMDNEDSFFDALVQASATSEQFSNSYIDKNYQRVEEEDYPYEQKDELESQEEFSFINLIDEED